VIFGLADHLREVAKAPQKQVGRHCRFPVPLEQEKQTLFLIAKQPQRGRQSRAGALCPFIEAKRRPLTATAAKAIARQRAGTLAAPDNLAGQGCAACSSAMPLATSPLRLFVSAM
jgi:hypothetical protein